MGGSEGEQPSAEDGIAIVQADALRAKALDDVQTLVFAMAL
ncbi:MAG: hypothetical protein WBQ45_11710 [Roseiarcus sp.]